MGNNAKKEEEGGIGLRDQIMAIEARRVEVLKKIVTRDRQPWILTTVRYSRGGSIEHAPGIEPGTF